MTPGYENRAARAIVSTRLQSSKCITVAASQIDILKVATCVREPEMTAMMLSFLLDLGASAPQ